MNFFGAAKIFGVFVPLQSMFYCILKKEFSEIFKIWSFISGNFFQNLSEISQKFYEIFQLYQNRKKNIIFVSKLVQNYCIDKNLQIVPIKVQNGRVFLENLHFSKFSLPSVPKIRCFTSQKPDFFS